MFDRFSILQLAQMYIRIALLFTYYQCKPEYTQHVYTRVVPFQMNYYKRSVSFTRH